MSVIEWSLCFAGLKRLLFTLVKTSQSTRHIMNSIFRLLNKAEITSNSSLSSLGRLSK